MAESNTPGSDGNDTEIMVEDGILPRFGIITYDAVDSDEFRELRGGAAPRVYMILSLFADKAMTCYPTQNTIARVAGVRRQTVNAAIRDLCAAGLLKRDAFTKKGRDMVLYTLIRPPSKRRG